MFLEQKMVTKKTQKIRNPGPPPLIWKSFPFSCFLLGSRKEGGYSTVRLTVRGGRGSATLALTVSKCEIFDPFFKMEYDSMVLKQFFSHCERSQKCIFNAFNASAIPLSDRFMTEQQRLKGGVENFCSCMRMAFLG